MSSYTVFVVFIGLVAACIAQDTDPFDDAHNCELFRRCKDCSSLEYCVKLGTSWLQRWWQGCPSWTPYCNPYSQTCEATITPICKSLLPQTG